MDYTRNIELPNDFEIPKVPVYDPFTKGYTFKYPERALPPGYTTAIEPETPDEARLRWQKTPIAELHAGLIDFDSRRFNIPKEKLLLFIEAIGHPGLHTTSVPLMEGKQNLFREGPIKTPSKVFLLGHRNLRGEATRNGMANEFFFSRNNRGGLESMVKSNVNIYKQIYEYDLPKHRTPGAIHTDDVNIQEDELNNGLEIVFTHNNLPIPGVHKTLPIGVLDNIKSYLPSFPKRESKAKVGSSRVIAYNLQGIKGRNLYELQDTLIPPDFNYPGGFPEFMEARLPEDPEINKLSKYVAGVLPKDFEGDSTEFAAITYFLIMQGEDFNREEKTFNDDPWDNTIVVMDRVEDLESAFLDRMKRTSVEHRLYSSDYNPHTLIRFLDKSRAGEDTTEEERIMSPPYRDLNDAQTFLSGYGWNYHTFHPANIRKYYRNFTPELWEAILLQDIQDKFSQGLIPTFLGNDEDRINPGMYPPRPSGDNNFDTAIQENRNWNVAIDKGYELSRMGLN